LSTFILHFRSKNEKNLKKLSERIFNLFRQALTIPLQRLRTLPRAASSLAIHGEGIGRKRKKLKLKFETEERRGHVPRHRKPDSGADPLKCRPVLHLLKTAVPRDGALSIIGEE